MYLLYDKDFCYGLIFVPLFVFLGTHIHFLENVKKSEKTELTPPHMLIFMKHALVVNKKLQWILDRHLQEALTTEL